MTKYPLWFETIQTKPIFASKAKLTIHTGLLVSLHVAWIFNVCCNCLAAANATCFILTFVSLNYDEGARQDITTTFKAEQKEQQEHSLLFLSRNLKHLVKYINISRTCHMRNELNCVRVFAPKLHTVIFHYFGQNLVTNNHRLCQQTPTFCCISIGAECPNTWRFAAV